MNFRIFDKVCGWYLDKTFVLGQDGQIIHLIDQQACGWAIEYLDPRNFIVEPWTGYLDINGRKIFRGDILGAEDWRGGKQLYSGEVIWYEGTFWIQDALSDLKMHIDGEIRAWKRAFVKGNIHGVEYNP